MFKFKPVYETWNNKELLDLLRKRKLTLGINNDLARIGGNEEAMHRARDEAFRRLHAYDNKRKDVWRNVGGVVGFLGGIAGIVSLILQIEGRQ